MVLSSFKQPGEIVTTDLKILPQSPNLENYRTAMTTVPFARFFLNSLIVTTVGSTVKVHAGHPDRLRPGLCPLPVQERASSC